MDDCQCESRSDSRIDGIASGLQDFNTHLGSELMHSNDHRMLRMDRVSGGRADRNSKEEQSGCEQRS